MNANDTTSDDASRLPSRIRPWLQVLKLALVSIGAALGIMKTLGML